MSDLDHLETMRTRVEQVGAAVEKWRRTKRRNWRLHEAAIELGKSRRTLQRWCEKGFIPRAFRTKGGHWRIPSDIDFEEVKKGARGFARQKWDHRFPADPDLYMDRIDNALVGLTDDDFKIGIDPRHQAYERVYGFARWDQLRQYRDADESKLFDGQRMVHKLMQKGWETDLRIPVLLAARSLRSESIKVNAIKICRFLGISRSQFYRRATKSGGISEVRKCFL